MLLGLIDLADGQQQLTQIGVNLLPLAQRVRRRQMLGAGQGAAIMFDALQIGE